MTNKYFGQKISSHSLIFTPVSTSYFCILYFAFEKYCHAPAGLQDGKSQNCMNFIDFLLLDRSIYSCHFFVPWIAISLIFISSSLPPNFLNPHFKYSVKYYSVPALFIQLKSFVPLFYCSSYKDFNSVFPFFILPRISILRFLLFPVHQKCPSMFIAVSPVTSKSNKIAIKNKYFLPQKQIRLPLWLSNTDTFAPTQQLFFFKTHFASDPKQCLFGWVQ